MQISQTPSTITMGFSDANLIQLAISNPTELLITLTNYSHYSISKSQSTISISYFNPTHRKQ